MAPDWEGLKVYERLKLHRMKCPDTLKFSSHDNLKLRFIAWDQNSSKTGNSRFLRFFSTLQLFMLELWQEKLRKFWNAIFRLSVSSKPIRINFSKFFDTMREIRANSLDIPIVVSQKFRLLVFWHKIRSCWVYWGQPKEKLDTALNETQFVWSR